MKLPKQVVLVGVIATATPGLKDDNVIFFMLGALIGALLWESVCRSSALATGLG